MRTSFETSKAMRGTKRVCPACEVRFYDLAREVIVCPSCGAPYTPPSPLVAEAEPATPPYTKKIRWRGRSLWRPGPVSRADDSQPSTSPEVAASAEQGDEGESAPEVVTDDEIVLEQDPDDAEVSDQFDHDAEEPKEQ